MLSFVPDYSLSLTNSTCKEYIKLMNELNSSLKAANNMSKELPFILTDNQITVILPSGSPKTVNSTSKYYSEIIKKSFKS